MAKQNILMKQLAKWQKQADKARHKIVSQIHKQINSHQGEIDHLRDMLANYGVAISKKIRPVHQSTSGTKTRRRKRMSSIEKGRYQDAVLKLAHEKHGVKRSDIVKTLKLTPIQATTLLGGLVRDKKLKQQGTKATTRYMAA